MRNKLTAVLSLCTLLAVLLCSRALADTFYPAEPVSIDVTYGFDNAAKGGRFLPVTVSLTNNTSEEFSGTIKIISMESDNEVYNYTYPITLSGTESAVKSYDVSLSNRGNTLYLVLYDNSNIELIRKRVKLDVNLDVAELFIGILSDTPEKLAYMSGVGVDYGTLRTKAFVLDTKNMPVDSRGLDQLDVILASNFRMRDLSEQQTRAIMEWVRAGGVLLMGTGMRADDTLGRFAPELLDDIYDDPQSTEVYMGQEAVYDLMGNKTLTIPCIDIALHGGNVILPGDDIPILTAVNKEKGIIAVAAYDFVDIASYCSMDTSYIDNLFTRLLGEDRITALAQAVYTGNSDLFWSVQSMINTGDVDRLPIIPLYVVEMAAYLFLIGPGLYIFLKQHDLGKYYGQGVVVLSILFACIIYLMGNRTRFSDTFYTYATIQNTDEDKVTETTYLNIRTPYNRSYSVSLNPSYSVAPITRNSTDSAVQFMGDEAAYITIEHRPDSTVISSDITGAFEPQYFQLEQRKDNTDKIGITGNIYQFDGVVTGTVTNNYQYALEDMALLLYGRMIIIGNMGAGETISLDKLPVINYPLGEYTSVASVISGGNRYTNTDISDKEYMKAFERTNLLAFYFNNYQAGYTADARVLAFAKDDIKHDFQNNDRFETYGTTLLTAVISVDNKKDSYLSRSVLIKTPSVVSGTYSAKNNTMNSGEPLILEYSLGNDISISSIRFCDISPVFTDDTKENIINAFSGNIAFYNYNSGDYDIIDITEESFDINAFGTYLSPGNVLTVKYIYTGSGSKQDIVLPMLYVVGRER